MQKNYIQIFGKAYSIPIHHQATLYDFKVLPSKWLYTANITTHESPQFLCNNYPKTETLPNPIKTLTKHAQKGNKLVFQPTPCFNYLYSQSHKVTLECDLMKLVSTYKDIGNVVYQFSYAIGDTIPVSISDCENRFLVEAINDFEPQSEPLWQDVFFNNPSKDNPVSIEELLKHLDLSEIAPKLDVFYGDKKCFRYEPEAVLRTLIYWKLKGYKFLRQVFNELLTSPTLANSLGFGMIPAYSQLWNFINRRLKKDGMKKLFDMFLEVILKEADKKGIPLGLEVMTDSTPLQAKKKDPDATYNTHYKMFGYKLHTVRCALTGIPLDYHVSTITEYDGYMLPPQLLRLRLKNIEPSKIYMDGAYASVENIARLKLFWNDIEIKCNIPKEWIIHREANESQIFKTYNQLWNAPLFVPKADFEYQKLLLLMSNDDENTNKHELVGQYYRNQILKEFYQNPQKYLDDYHLRNRIESRHGNEKLLTNIGSIDCRGIERFTAHVGLHLVSILALALTRLQNGVTKGLVDLGGLI